MGYRDDIKRECLEALESLLALSLREDSQIRPAMMQAIEQEALSADTATTPQESYPLSPQSRDFLTKLAMTNDHNMVKVTEKVLKSLKYATITAVWQEIP